MDGLLIEVNRTIAAYRAADPGAAIDRIVLAGSAGISDRLVQAFRDRFGVQADLFAVPDAVKWRSDVEGSAAPFSACMGIILSQLGEASGRFDFVHPKELQAEHRERARRRPVWAAVVAMFVLAGSVAAYQPIAKKNRAIDRVVKEMNENNKDVKSREAALKKIDDLTLWQQGNVVWLDYMRRLAEVFPSNKDCYITKWEADTSRGTATLTLATADRYVASKVVSQIKAVQDDKKKPIFDAVAGQKTTDNIKDPEYPVTDTITVTVLSLAPKKK